MSICVFEFVSLLKPSLACLHILPVSFLILVADSMGASVRPSNSSTSARAWTGKDKAKEEKAAVFQPPLLVPTKDEWVKDESVPSCMVCQTERFSMVRKPHYIIVPCRD